MCYIFLCCCCCWSVVVFRLIGCNFLCLLLKVRYVRGLSIRSFPWKGKPDCVEYIRNDFLDYRANLFLEMSSVTENLFNYIRDKPTDVNLKIKNEVVIKCHKIILAANSKIFSVLCDDKSFDLKEQDKEITINIDWKSIYGNDYKLMQQSLEKCLNFLYGKDINITSFSECIDVICCANFFLLDLDENIIRNEFFGANLTSSSSMEELLFVASHPIIFKLSRESSMAAIKNRLICSLGVHLVDTRCKLPPDFSSVVQPDDFLEMISSEVFVLKDQGIPVNKSELCILKLAVMYVLQLNWKDGGRLVFARILRSISFENISEIDLFGENGICIDKDDHVRRKDMEVMLKIRKNLRSTTKSGVIKRTIEENVRCLIQDGNNGILREVHIRNAVELFSPVKISVFLHREINYVCGIVIHHANNMITGMIKCSDVVTQSLELYTNGKNKNERVTGFTFYYNYTSLDAIPYMCGICLKTNYRRKGKLLGREGHFAREIQDFGNRYLYWFNPVFVHNLIVTDLQCMWAYRKIIK